MKTNLQKLKVSRKQLMPGDFFAYKVLNQDFRFGRVIKTNAKIGGFDEVNLLYFFGETAPSLEKVPDVGLSDLLIPPVGTNRLGFSRGYFQWLSRGELLQSDVLSRHCFHDSLRDRYYDEYSAEIPRKSNPCGDYGLHSFGTIDNAISDALGIPWAEYPEGYPRDNKPRQ